MGKGRQTAPYDVPQCMTFHPTVDQIQDFQAYMEYMEKQGAHQAGIAKIVLPKEWIPRKVGYGLDTLQNIVVKRPIKQEFTNVGEDKRAFQTKSSSRGPMSIQEYYEMAQNHTYRTPPHNSHDDLERKYWKSLSFVPPIYGADITDSITDPDCNVFNMAKLPSILQYVNQDQNESYAGVTTPYLYLGSWKTTFSWHVEDMDLYAINYLHFGMPKTWYCIPPKYGHLLEKACRTLFPNVTSCCSNFMRHKTCLINPSLLDELGVPYQKVVQEVRNAIVVYPYAYHSGFNHGFNCAESTNFALERWIEYGKRYRPCDCTSNNVKINMDCFVKRFQPDVYDKWMAGNDIGPHPEDPPDVVALIKLKSECPETYAAIMTEKFQKEAENLSEKIMFYTSTGRNLAVFKSTLRLVRGDSVLSSIEKKEFEFWKLEQRNNSKIIFQEAGGPIVSVDRRLVHIYQHAELKQIKIKVLPRTLTIIGDGLALLKQSLPNERFKCVKELIDKGVLIKIGERQMKRKRDIKKIPDEPQPVKSDKSLSKYENNKKMIEKVVYELKHSYLDLKALVFSDNMNKYYGNHTDALTTFMEGSDMNTLVQSNIFTKVNEFKVFIEENDDIPIALGVKDDGFELYSIFKNNSTGNYIAINPQTLCQPNIKQENLQLSPDQTIQDLLRDNKLTLIEENKKFKKNIEHVFVSTDVRTYFHKELKMDFHMTKKIPPKIFYKGRPKKKLIDFFKDVNMEEILASDMVSYKEDNCFYVYKAMAEYGKKAKESVITDITMQKYFLHSKGKNRVKVHVIRWRNKILYRLALESEEIKCQECLTNEKFQDLINRRVLRESNCRRIHDINRLDKIIKCDLVPRKLFKFKVRGHPNQYVYTNLEQTEILIKLPEELRIMQKSPVEAMIKAEILYDGQEDDTISYEGLGALEEIIMSKTKSTEELNESQYEINHPLLDVHVVKNYRDNEMIIIKKIELKSILILDDDTKQEVNKVNELVKAESEEEIVPSTSNDFLIKEDEEVDEDDYDDIEESEDEIFIPEIEENSDDDKSCAFSDDDPDFKVNGNRNSIVMPGVRRRKRSQSKIRKTRGRGRGKGKKPRTTKTKGKETTTHSNIRSFNPVTILNSMSDQDEMKPYMNHVLNILESSKLIMKNQEEFVWTSNDIEEAVNEALESSYTVPEIKIIIDSILTFSKVSHDINNKE
uniref:Uncharacterized protein n=1 Tax=Lepeophtheirus salmonis TaxID=72036 RepID=A0A0K2ULN7_LEPSM